MKPTVSPKQYSSRQSHHPSCQSGKQNIKILSQCTLGNC